MAGQNKRFLGLGFTFAAEDKGLEKKLTNIRNLFQEIDSLSSKQGKKKGAAFSTGVEQKINVSSDEETGRKQPGKRTAQSVIKEVGAIKDQTKKSMPTSADYNKIIADMASKLTGDTQKIFMLEGAKIVSGAIKNGVSLSKVQEKMSDFASKMKESEEHASTFTYRFKAAADYIKVWAKDLGSSLSNFLDTIGINLKELVPKELVAAFGVLKSVVNPLIHGVQKGVGVVKEKVGGFLNSAFESKNEKGLKEISKTIGDSMSLSTPQQSLSDIRDAMVAQNESKKEGIFDKIKGFLGKFGGLIAGGLGIFGLFKYLGKLGGLFSALGRGVAWLFTSISEAGGLWAVITKAGTALWEMFTSGFGALRALFSGEAMSGIIGSIAGVIADIMTSISLFISNPVSSIGFLLSEVGSAFAGFAAAFAEITAIVVIVVAAVTAIAGFLWGFAKEIPNIVSAIWNFIKAGFNFVTTLGKWVYTMLEPGLGPIVEGLKSFGTIIAGVIQWIFEKFSAIGGGLGKLVAGVYNGVADVLNSGTAAMQKSIDNKNAERANQEAPQQIIIPQGGNSNLKELSDMALNQEISSENDALQTDLMKEQNRTLVVIADRLGMSQQQAPINVRVDKDNRVSTGNNQTLKNVASGNEG